MDNACTGYLLTKTQQQILGFFLLILVDVIWVSSRELAKYLIINENYEYDKPFFSTYIRSSLFSIYLLGFCVWSSWRQVYCITSQKYVILDDNLEDELIFSQSCPSLSNPIYVPIKHCKRESFDKNSGTESDDQSARSVRFNKLAEVRQMSESEAVEAMMARLPYHISKKIVGNGNSVYCLSLCKIIKISFVAGLLWFVANYSYALAVKVMPGDMVNLLSSTSSIFTMIFCCLFPTTSNDKFSLSKLFAVLTSIFGLGLVIFSRLSVKFSMVTQGALLAFLHAFFIALYIVFVNRKMDREEKIDIPLLFGFIGVINLFVLWPIMLLLNLNDCEHIEWPTGYQWSDILINGFIGTVITEVLWIWGAFLTSPLVALLILSLIHPLSMLSDILLGKVTYPELFYAGSIPMILAVGLIMVLNQYENWDPAFNILHRAYSSIFSKFSNVRTRISEQNSEQSEALISIDSEHEA